MDFFGLFLRDEEVKNHSDDSSNKDYGGRELVVGTRTEGQVDVHGVDNMIVIESKRPCKPLLGF